MRLDSVASFRETLGPSHRQPRFDLQYAATFYSPPRPLPWASGGRVKRSAAELLPTGYQVKLIGQAGEFSKTQKYMSFTFPGSLTLLLHGAGQPVQQLRAALHRHAGPALAIVGGVAACGPPQATPSTSTR